MVAIEEGCKENCSDLAVAEPQDNTRRLSKGHGDLPRSSLERPDIQQFFNCLFKRGCKVRYYVDI